MQKLFGQNEVNFSRKTSVAWLQNEGRNAVSKFRRAISMKIAKKDRKNCNITEELDRRKAASKSKSVKASKSLSLHCIQMGRVIGSPNYMRCILHSGRTRPL